MMSWANWLRAFWPQSVSCAKAAFQSRIGRSSLIMVSHQEGILRDLCQAGIFLDGGEAIWYDSIDEAIAAYHEATGGPPRKQNGNQAS